MAGKFLRYKRTPEDGDTFVLFEKLVGHDDMFNLLRKTYPKATVVSAGFWSIIHTGRFKAYGESISLKVKSIESDTMMLNYNFETNLLEESNG